MEAIQTMADMAARSEKPDVLFWIGCAGSFDDRAKKITHSFAELLQKAGVSFAVLGQEDRNLRQDARLRRHHDHDHAAVRDHHGRHSSQH